MHRTKAEIRLLKQELRKANHQDNKLTKAAARKSNDTGVSGKIREKIPEKVLSSLEGAFEKAFTLLYTKGDAIYEKMGGIDKAREEYAKLAASLDRMIYSETLKAVDQAASSRIARTKGITTVEGSGLGLLGIGLPDIPLFLAMLLKTAYEIAAGYGIDYREPKEKRYGLALLSTCFSKGEERIQFSKLCDEIGTSIDTGDDVNTEIDENDISEVSNVLATGMLVNKFVQGLTFAGVLGGPMNYAMIHKVSKVAKAKYRKRFLYRLLQD